MKAHYFVSIVLSLVFSIYQQTSIWDTNKVERVLRISAPDPAGYRTTVSGSKVTLPKKGKYKIYAEIKDLNLKEADGERVRFLIYQPVKCKNEPCWEIVRQFSSGDSPSERQWRFMGQKDEQLLISVWLPSWSMSRSGPPITYLSSSISPSNPFILRISGGTLAINIEKLKD